MAKAEKPFNRILKVAGTLKMVANAPEMTEHAIPNMQDFLIEANAAFEDLLAFRNIINAMATLDEKPSDAVRPYIDDEG